ncbi:precorrin-2 C(20)-methyltransferase [Deinococcus peraridilitoris]|uniref:precorrin-2 C(20)-methyltransferase n=1 Tax=Deinococcus peraridilitoris TaxID=432329 RepID=UPI001FDF74DC|nr:precorrin-2 C(20)-methyltransferase [Deinococcus peraridilitoris]
MKPGTFYGVGVGPGPQGLLPVAALEALRTVNVIFTPRSSVSGDSVARHCLRGLGLPEERFREVEFFMNTDPAQLARQYAQLAREIAHELRAGRDVAYLTIGDTFTYSTYGYTLAALREELPEAPRITFPGVTSYAAAAAALEFPLGEGKERTLILPCPDDMAQLRREIETHDVVILMKIAQRFGAVRTLLHDLGIAQHCVLAARLGLPGEALHHDLSGDLSGDLTAPSNLAQATDLTQATGERLGYLSTLLIRKAPPRNSSSAGTARAGGQA